MRQDSEGRSPSRDDVLIGGDAPGEKRQGRKALLLVVGQRADAASQLTEEDVMFGMRFGWFGHASPLPGGSALICQPPLPRIAYRCLTLSDFPPHLNMD